MKKKIFFILFLNAQIFYWCCILSVSRNTGNIFQVNNIIKINNTKFINENIACICLEVNICILGHPNDVRHRDFT